MYLTHNRNHAVSTKEYDIIKLLDDYLHVSRYMGIAQKSIRNNNRGLNHQLLVDRAVYQDSKTLQTNLNTTCIVWRKAYDLVPYQCHIWTRSTPVLMGNTAEGGREFQG